MFAMFRRKSGPARSSNPEEGETLGTKAESQDPVVASISSGGQAANPCTGGSGAGSGGASPPPESVTPPHPLVLLKDEPEEERNGEEEEVMTMCSFVPPPLPAEVWEVAPLKGGALESKGDAPSAIQVWSSSEFQEICSTRLEEEDLSPSSLRARLATAERKVEAAAVASEEERKLRKGLLELLQNAETRLLKAEESNRVLAKQLAAQTTTASPSAAAPGLANLPPQARKAAEAALSERKSAAGSTCCTLVVNNK